MLKIGEYTDTLDSLNGYISPEGHVYLCQGPTYHLELSTELIKEGILDVAHVTGDKVHKDYANVATAATDNGWIKIRDGFYYAGMLSVSVEDLDVDITREQLSTIIHISSRYRTSYINFNNQPLTLTDFLTKIKSKDQVFGIISLKDNQNYSLSRRMYGNKMSMLAACADDYTIVDLMPDTICVPNTVIQKIIDGEDMYHVIQDAILKYIGGSRQLEVRSSPSVSMPGRMISKHNVNPDGFYDAVKEVIDSWYSDSCVSYRNELGLSHEFSGGIGIQACVPTTAFTLYSNNPITGEQGTWADVFQTEGPEAMNGESEGIFLPVLNHPLLSEELQVKCNKIHYEIRNHLRTTLPLRLEMGFDGDNLVIYQIKFLSAVSMSAQDLVPIDGILIMDGQAASLGLKTLTLRHGSEGLTEDDLYVCTHVDNNVSYSNLMSAGGLITAHGGFSSHGGELARQISKEKIYPAIVGAGFRIKMGGIVCLPGQEFVPWGTTVIIVGGTGQVYLPNK